MPWSEDRKPHTRARILQAAARLFTRHGFDGTSIDTIMQQAGLTRGAFYAHFASKGELYAMALRHAAQEGAARVEQESDPCARMALYLSETHLYSEDLLCPLACLVSDVAQQEERVRETYTRLLEGFIAFYAGQSEPDSPARRQALQQAVTMIGGMAIARTLTDPALADELLEACRELASSLIPLDDRPSTPASTGG
ncbi:TetR/AcrR family transcriptional regulator [Billgrantia gudaonensis]|uniref:Transcriptional regulator, TetR family n=1 Tax=Billgrantia gudaonensis TaxID=376427 RepID=A0A1G9CIT0_9GAMM|nr:TetR/AcrR family transcriptional regulator [Halomonas gudaonensis]SDK51569.1 transcriptional regulator, TetR family [Halomonas gudaonensis]